MRVIGKTKDGVLIEASDDELARICGFASMSSLAREDVRIENPNSNSWDRRMRIGSVIHVSPMWDWMTRARETFAKLQSTGKLLHGLADILDAAPPAALMEPEPTESERKPG